LLLVFMMMTLCCRHEHLYEDALDRNLIRPDELPEDALACERVFVRARVVLCTLGMLSNPALVERGVFDTIPVERLVIDEASQINVFDFLVSLIPFRDALSDTQEFGCSISSIALEDCRR
jgi:hypothetical protein